jgi:hypothetical protein
VRPILYANVVIRHAQPQHRNPQHIHQLAQRHVGNRIRIPVRQKNQRPPPLSREPARVHHIVLRIRRAHRRRESQKVGRRSLDLRLQLRVGHLARAENLHIPALQPEVRRNFIGIKVVAGGNNALIEINEKLRGILRRMPRTPAIAARPLPRPLRPPFQRTHHAVIVHRSQPVFPVIHPLCIARGHLF